ncbi:MAG TPA: nitrite/sulfite reductase [Vicinamibacterales bacterium]
MSATDETRTLGRARLSFASQEDLDEFVAKLEAFEDGRLSPDEWRAFRLLRGLYGQRQPDDFHMLRVKIPQGVLSAAQLEALADVAERWSRGFGHITTRQNIQFHFVRLHDAEPAMQYLADAGLTTREACGNSVRNVTACPYAGIAPDEVFDVTPYAEALTRFFLRHPLAGSLPRKFKIGFEGCPEDHAFTGINDIGWRAAVRTADGRTERGFRVSVGGGTSILPRAAQVLFDFLPAGEMLSAAEAVVRVFHRLGDYKHKHRNRMKFLIKQLGWERFRDEVLAEYEAIRAEGGRPLPFDPEHPPVEEAPDWARSEAPDRIEIAQRALGSRVTGPGITPTVRPRLEVRSEEFLTWQRTNVRPQKQPGWVYVTVRLPLGDFTGAQMRILADLARAYSDGSVRISPDQNLIFRWVPVDAVEPLHARLAAAGLAAPNANTVRDITSCPGAESCKLAVTQSRGLGSLLGEHLDANPHLIDQAPGVVIKISGCPNGCGQHHIATIGFQGSVRKVDGRPVPQYFVMVGGGAEGEQTTFGRLAAKIPARRAPEALSRLIALYQAERHDGESARSFFRRVDLARVKAVVSDLETLTAETAAPDDFIDLGETAAFRPEVQDGECAAP